MDLKLLINFTVLMSLLAIFCIYKPYIFQLSILIITSVFILGIKSYLSDYKNDAIKQYPKKSGKFTTQGSLSLNKLVNIQSKKDEKYKQLLEKSRFLKCNSFVQYNNKRILENESNENIVTEVLSNGYRKKLARSLYPRSYRLSSDDAWLDNALKQILFKRFSDTFLVQKSLESVTPSVVNKHLSSCK